MDHNGVNRTDIALVPDGLNDPMQDDSKGPNITSNNKEVTIPTNGYILDIIVVYENSMVNKFGNNALSRYLPNSFSLISFSINLFNDLLLIRLAAVMAHAQIIYQFSTVPAKMKFNILSYEKYSGYYTVKDGL